MRRRPFARRGIVGAFARNRCEKSARYSGSRPGVSVAGSAAFAHGVSASPVDGGCQRAVVVRLPGGGRCNFRTFGAVAALVFRLFQTLSPLRPLARRIPGAAVERNFWRNYLCAARFQRGNGAVFGGGNRPFLPVASAHPFGARRCAVRLLFGRGSQALGVLPARGHSLLSGGRERYFAVCRCIFVASGAPKPGILPNGGKRPCNSFPNRL